MGSFGWGIGNSKIGFTAPSGEVAEHTERMRVADPYMQKPHPENRRVRQPGPTEANFLKGLARISRQSVRILLLTEFIKVLLYNE